MKVAIVGAESTGKTTLAAALAQALRSLGHDAVMVSEYLREFCDRHARTPQRHEQAQIADEQTRRIEDAARRHALVVADTTALMTAVYSDVVFGDRLLYAGALQAHRSCEMTLLTALDLPWQADGLIRDGAHVRAPVQARLRAAFAQGGIAYGVVCGSGKQRLQCALGAVVHRLRLPLAEPDAAADLRVRWQAVCERCGDVNCERHSMSAGRRG